MEVVKNKVIFKFTKKDVMALRQLANMLYEESMGAISFSAIIHDIIADSEDEVFDFTSFDTFSIEVEK